MQWKWMAALQCGICVKQVQTVWEEACGPARGTWCDFAELGEPVGEVLWQLCVEIKCVGVGDGVCTGGRGCEETGMESQKGRRAQGWKAYK